MSEEYPPEELTFDISCQSTSSEAEAIKGFLRGDGANHLRKQFETYVNDLRYGSYALIEAKLILFRI